MEKGNFNKVQFFKTHNEVLYIVGLRSNDLFIKSMVNYLPTSELNVTNTTVIVN